MPRKPYRLSRWDLSVDEANQLSDMAIYRYGLWRSRRRHRLTKAEAFAAALALTRNEAEQRERAYAHDTGAEPR